MFLAFPPFEFAILAWVAIIPLILVISESTKKQAFWYSCITFAIFYTGLLYWLVNVTMPGLIILVIILTIISGFFGVMASIVMKYSMDLLIIPFIWVIFEYLKSHIFTGFPWGLLAHSQYKNINLIQIADITGVYGISFVIIAFNMAFFAVIKRRERKIAYLMVSLLFIVISTSYGIYKSDNLNLISGPRISVVQGNIPQEQKWDSSFAEDILSVYAGLSKQAASDSPDLIVWPETSFPYLAEAGRQPAKEIKDLAKELNIPILAGIAYFDGDRYYNSAILFDGDNEFLDIYSKMHLVPFGEYVPLENLLSFLRKHIDKPIGDFGKGTKYTVFPVTSLRNTNSSSGALMRSISFNKFGVLICFEDIFPYISRGFVSEGANFLINITNDAWFGRTAASKQHMISSVFRAVENRVSVVRAANTGISCFIDPTGKVTSSVTKGGHDIFIEGYETKEIDIARTRTYYNVYGDIFVYFCAIMLILLFATEYIESRRRKKQ